VAFFNYHYKEIYQNVKWESGRFYFDVVADKIRSLIRAVSESNSEAADYNEAAFETTARY
jgi:hypothetical protein